MLRNSTLGECRTTPPWTIPGSHYTNALPNLERESSASLGEERRGRLSRSVVYFCCVKESGNSAISFSMGMRSINCCGFLPRSNQTAPETLPLGSTVAGLSARARICRAVLLSVCLPCWRTASSSALRSEEHTSELQSHLNLVCRLLLEKKKKSSLKHMQTSIL